MEQSDEEKVSSILVEMRSLRNYITYMLVAFLISVLLFFPLMLYLMTSLSRDINVGETRVRWLEKSKIEVEGRLDKLEEFHPPQNVEEEGGR